jgi:hypothetical protein
MSLILTRLPGEPVIIIKPALPVEQNIEHVFSIHAQCAHIASGLGSPLYRIMDFRLADLAYSDILLLLDIEKENGPGSLTDPQMRTVLVGYHPLLKIAARKARQQFSVHIPIFDSMSEALACIRASTGARSGTAGCAT